MCVCCIHTQYTCVSICLTHCVCSPSRVNKNPRKALRIMLRILIIMVYNYLHPSCRRLHHRPQHKDHLLASCCAWYCQRWRWLYPNHPEINKQFNKQSTNINTPFPGIMLCCSVAGYLLPCSLPPPFRFVMSSPLFQLPWLPQALNSLTLSMTHSNDFLFLL